MHRRFFIFAPMLLLFFIGIAYTNTQQQPEYPIMEKVAQKVIEKYQKSSCADLKGQKQQQPSPEEAQMKKRVIEALKKDPKMRQDFMDRVAGPIANKMFECGMIP